MKFLLKIHFRNQDPPQVARRDVLCPALLGEISHFQVPQQSDFRLSFLMPWNIINAYDLTKIMGKRGENMDNSVPLPDSGNADKHRIRGNSENITCSRFFAIGL